MSRKSILGVASLAAATLLLESGLIRLLSVAQFYHFAFLVISLALLGFGASGSFLTLFPKINERSIEHVLSISGFGFAVSIVIGYAVINLLPFDSYSIAWDRRQVFYFILYYLALAAPFFFSGMGVGAGLAVGGGKRHQVYSANLIGSGVGALGALIALDFAGVPGALLASGLLGLIPVVIRRRSWVPRAITGIGMIAFVFWGFFTQQRNIPIGMAVSPYKGLSRANQYPGSESRFGSWNAISRVDVIANAGIHKFPGLSYAYRGQLPDQYGLSIDAGDLQPITLVEPQKFNLAEFLPESFAFQMRPEAQVLVIEPGGGLAIHQALQGGAREIVATMNNPLAVAAIRQTSPVTDIYHHPQVNVVPVFSRVFLSSTSERFDLAILPLTDGYLPITSGAYSLAEDYSLTVEAFQAMLSVLEPNGLLVISRWLQTPPSESIRMIASLIHALENHSAVDPAETLVVYRSIQTVTALAQPDGWSRDELTALLDFTAERRFDLIWSPTITGQDVNRFNRFPEPYYFAALQALLESKDRMAFYQSFPFNIEPPSDDHPFFFHFFTAQQTPQVLASFGRTLQPFGGSGYFVLVALLALVITLSVLLILLPLFVRRPIPKRSIPAKYQVLVLGYFLFLGIAFLFIEIPLIQRLILLVGHPSYAFTYVLVIVMSFSGIGSWMASRFQRRRIWLFGGVVFFSLLTPGLVSRLIPVALQWPLIPRLMAGMFALAPLSFLMGFPFPMGLARLGNEAPTMIPWAWAVNGCASVVASVSAAILSLTYNFTTVLYLGALSYAMAAILFPFLGSRKWHELDPTQVRRF